MDSLPSPLSPFLALPGEPPIPWVRWLESFETFIVAAGLAEANDDRKKALLMHSLGSEGQRIFRTRSEICGLCYTAHWTLCCPTKCYAPVDCFSATPATGG
ncbi:hypothetical protein CgunFtcFv8_009273 [Champsocephalus gunnari]|uniref:Uncharacterized protein n=1 Tax=Champsocephalus gunnari TaxID=52237 RepID=A0AAN8C3W8_CHAGU|nr:hypothetical protein CgunFtcFv8_009273 [Champsocephalus gunnari]